MYGRRSETENGADWRGLLTSAFCLLFSKEFFRRLARRPEMMRTARLAPGWRPRHRFRHCWRDARK